MPLILPSGASSVGGDELTSAYPLYMDGRVWYVHSGTGVDSASPRGLEAKAPLATLGQAITNAANDDMIVLLSGHSQTVSSGITVNKKLTIVGEGTSGGKPAATLRRSADVALLTITALYVSLRNIYFPTDTVACSTNIRVDAQIEDTVIEGCYFEIDGNSTGFAWALVLGHHAHVKDCTFVSSATSGASRPVQALLNLGKDGVVMDGVTLDGGTYGWATYAVTFSGQTEMFRITGLRLLRGSDFDVSGATPNTGFIQIVEATGGSRVEWA